MPISPPTVRPPRNRRRTDRHDAFLDRLASMSPAARLLAARRGEFARSERALWARLYPDEVPTVNGEVEWIALDLADLD
jgi:hypothetical protein